MTWLSISRFSRQDTTITLSKLSKTHSKSRHNPFQSLTYTLNTYLEINRVREVTWYRKILLFEEEWRGTGGVCLRRRNRIEKGLETSVNRVSNPFFVLNAKVSYIVVGCLCDNSFHSNKKNTPYSYRVCVTSSSTVPLPSTLSILLI